MKRGRGSGKSRSGCQTCKNRKIKCDEAKPTCEACTRSGIPCPGYTRPLKWSRKHEMHANASTATSISSHRYNVAYGQSGLGFNLSPDALSGTSLSGAASGMPIWLGMDLNGEETESAFQEATVLMSQDLTAATPPFMYSGLLDPDPSPVAETLPQQHSNANSGTNGTRDRDSTLNPSFAGSMEPGDGAGAGNHEIQKKPDCPADRREASNRPCALLHTLYRLSTPRNLRRLSDDDFVGYYFNHVCRLHSCFDSDENFFHSLAAKWWSTCRTVSLTIQSMAIAHITNWYPYMAPLGVSKRGQAWHSLQKDLQLQRLGRFDLEKALLCLFLLGISASWQSSSNLGLQYLHITRNLIQGKLREPVFECGTEGLSDSWASALVHWEMLASFVDPVAITVFDGHVIPELHAQKLQIPIMPHPWTGVSTELNFILAEIGRVSRRRRRCSTTSITCPEQEHSHEQDHRWLQNLEQLLITTEIPDEAFIQDYKDPKTSKMDFIRTAEACRGIGLLEVYRLCPRLLQDRVADENGNQILPFTIPDKHVGYTRYTDQYLASIAAQTINIISQISLSSGVCRMQPLLMVASASHLRFPDLFDVSVDTEGTERLDYIVQSRYFVEARILALSRKLPQAPILRAMDIIKEVWDRLDNAEDGHWIDIMHENGWQTILG